MTFPARIEAQRGRFSLVDGIPYALPVYCKSSPALFAGFPIDLEAARKLLPGNEVHPFQLWSSGLLVITVIDYRDTSIGKYIEYSIAIACTHGKRPAPRLLPMVFQKSFDLGQFVFDLPVSTEVSVKGGKGIWGMPKHQANLDFVEKDGKISAQYDKDGKMAMRITIDDPGGSGLPFGAGGVNYCAFRGLLMKSTVGFRGKVRFSLRNPRAELLLGDHPNVAPLKTLNIGKDPLFTAYIPSATGYLDDHFEAWFLSEGERPTKEPEGLPSVVHLGRAEEWLAPPVRDLRLPPPDKE